MRRSRPSQRQWRSVHGAPLIIAPGIHTDDHLGLMDHLRIDKFMVLGFCIGGPMIWNFLQRAPDRIVAAVLAQPSGSRPEKRDLFYDNNMKGWAPGACKRRRDITMEQVGKIPDQDVSHQPRLRIHGDARFRPQLRDAGADPARRRPIASLCGCDGSGDAGAERRGEHVPLEGAQGADSARGAADPVLPARTRPAATSVPIAAARRLGRANGSGPMTGSAKLTPAP